MKSGKIWKNWREKPCWTAKTSVLLKGYTIYKAKSDPHGNREGSGLNILYVTGNYESVQKHLAEAFMRSGNDIKVFYYRIRNKKEKPDLLEHVLYYNSPFHMRGPVLLLFRLKAAALWCAKRMEKKPDILHGNMCFLDGCICRYLSHIWHVPYVLSVRDTDMNSSYLWAVPWLRRAGIRNLEQAKRILFLSEGYREMLLERLPKAAGDKIKAK